MTMRTASCRCGGLRIVCTGAPVRVSVCHCLFCQQRSGSAFAVQARWPDDRVAMTGDFRTWSRTGDSGKVSTYRFCAECGVTVAFASDGMPGVTAVPVGAFADPDFPPPRFSVHEARRHRWVAVLGDDVEHSD